MSYSVLNTMLLYFTDTAEGRKIYTLYSGSKYCRYTFWNKTASESNLTAICILTPPVPSLEKNDTNHLCYNSVVKKQL